VTKPKPSRKRWNIALGVVALFAVVGWFDVVVGWPAHERNSAIGEIERVDGWVVWEQVPVKLFGRYYVTHVFLSDTRISDKGLRYLSSLKNLQFLGLTNTKISDAGLKHLRSPTTLQELWLNGTHVSDNGLKHLSGLTSLQVLSLADTTISDEGLKHLSGLTSLQLLKLNDTQVTGEGVKMLQESLPNCHIDW
jgi:hypothetical protein